MSKALEEAIENARIERGLLIQSARPDTSGRDWCLRHTALIDAVVREAFHQATANLPAADILAVVATGGYGRNELAPFSDIDLTVVPEDEGVEGLDVAVRHLFQLLHDSLGTGLRLEIGYAYRLVSDAPGLDGRTRTGLLDARLVVGSPGAAQSLEAAVQSTLAAGPFLLEKLEERKAMERRHHDTPLVVEPHLKEGAGGLRSAQSARWIRRAIGLAPTSYTDEYSSVLAMRNALHRVSGRRNDHLTRSKLVEIAELIGERPDAILERLHESLLSLHRELESSVQLLHEARYDLAKGVHAVRGEARFDPSADSGHAAIGIATAVRLGLQTAEFSIATGSELDGPSALQAISTGEPTLRALDQTGLLKVLLPELVACRTLASDDAVHRYTVFEHTMRAVRMLDSLEHGNYLWDIKERLNEYPLLILALLLHDVGKQFEGKPHSESGAEIASDACLRWGLSTEDSALVAWLVREHLTMARFVEIRDIDNPSTVEEFAKVVGTPTRLDALTLLTWADVNAVAPGLWTSAKDSFLRTLYERTRDMVQSDADQAGTRAPSTRHLLRDMPDIPREELQEFIDSLPAQYLGATNDETLKLHFELYRRASGGNPAVEFTHHFDLAQTEVTIVSPDERGLLSRLLGVLYAHDLTVHMVRAATIQTDTPVAIDVFRVTFSNRQLAVATQQAVLKSLMAVLTDALPVETLLRQHGKDPDRRQRDFKWTFREGDPGVLEIRASPGRGLAYRFAHWITEQGWNITAARLGQWAGSGAAAFYLFGSDNRPLRRQEVEQALDDSGLGVMV